MVMENQRDPNCKNRAIIIDEAQDIIPGGKGSINDNTTVTKALGKKFETLAAQGRKYGISLIVASQQPAKINPSVISQSSTQVFFALSQEDLSNISNYIPKEYREIIMSLNPGNALVHSPEIIDLNIMEIITPQPPIFHDDPVDLYDPWYINKMENKKDNIDQDNTNSEEINYDET